MLLINKPGRYSYYKLELTCFELVCLVMLNDQTLSIIWISWVCAGVLFTKKMHLFIYNIFLPYEKNSLIGSLLN